MTGEEMFAAMTTTRQEHTTMTYPIHTDHGTYGLVLIGADPDGQNGYVRGITTFNDGMYMALTGVTSRHFKTLAGAIRYMERKGYDSHGRRV